MPLSATWRCISCNDLASAAWSHSGRHIDRQASHGLLLVAPQEAVDVDLLVGAQALGTGRHLHLEAFALGREADGVAYLGIAESDGGRIPLQLDAAHLGATRNQQRDCE